MDSKFPDIPKFTQAQVDWLNLAFPELTDTKATADTLFINLGQRRVIKRIEGLIADKRREVSVGG